MRTIFHLNVHCYCVNSPVKCLILFHKMDPAHGVQDPNEAILSWVSANQWTLKSVQASINLDEADQSELTKHKPTESAGTNHTALQHRPGPIVCLLSSQEEHLNALRGSSVVNLQTFERHWGLIPSVKVSISDKPPVKGLIRKECILTLVSISLCTKIKLCEFWRMVLTAESLIYW